MNTRRSVEDASSSAAAAAASAAAAAAAAYQSYEAEEYSYELNADGAGAGAGGSGMSGLLGSEERDGGSGIGGGLVFSGSRPLTACGTLHCVFIRGRSISITPLRTPVMIVSSSACPSVHLAG